MVVRISDKTQNYSKVTKLLVKPKNYRNRRKKSMENQNTNNSNLNKDEKQKKNQKRNVVLIGLALLVCAGAGVKKYCLLHRPEDPVS